MPVKQFYYLQSRIKAAGGGTKELWCQCLPRSSIDYQNNKSFPNRDVNVNPSYLQKAGVLRMNKEVLLECRARAEGKEDMKAQSVSRLV